MRVTPLVSGQYYHVYNRGVDKKIVFSRFGHYRRFTDTITSILETGSATKRTHYNQSLALKHKIRVIAYCLMPNHYHFLLFQNKDAGISEFMHKLDTSYTKYINLNIQRSGRFFENTFKAKHIENEHVFLHVARYIHLNPLIANLVTDLELWPWSSYLETIGKRTPSFCTIEEIHAYFPSGDEYKTFVANQEEYARLLHQASKQGEDGIFL